MDIGPGRTRRGKRPEFGFKWKTVGMTVETWIFEVAVLFRSLSRGGANCGEVNLLSGCEERLMSASVNM